MQFIKRSQNNQNLTELSQLTREDRNSVLTMMGTSKSDLTDIWFWTKIYCSPSLLFSLSTAKNPGHYIQKPHKQFLKMGGKEVDLTGSWSLRNHMVASSLGFIFASCVPNLVLEKPANWKWQWTKQAPRTACYSKEPHPCTSTNTPG